MKKYITFCFIVCVFIQTYSQNYRDEDFIGYINYMNIPLVNVRFNSLLFNYPISENQEWIKKNKIKKISYLVNEKLSQSNEYLKDGSIANSEFSSGSKYIYNRNKNELNVTEYYNNKEVSIISKQYSNDGRLIKIKNQYTSSKKDSTIKKFFYENARIIRSEQYYNDMIQYKTVFVYINGLLKNIILTDYKVEVKPGQTREYENINYEYDANQNCIKIENMTYFGALKNEHTFEYNTKRQLVKENYILNIGKNSKEEQGSILYYYDEKNRLFTIEEVGNKKGSIIKINYGENNKIKSATINSDTIAYSTYLPYSYYVGKNEKKYDLFYDNKENLIEIKEFFNGDLSNKTQFLIEYY